MRLLLLFLLTYLLLGSGVIFHNPFPEWDESEYMALGKYLFSGGESGYWDAIRPPVWPSLLGALWFLGIPLIPTAKLLALLFSLGVLGLVYLLGKDLFSPGAGLFAAVLLAMTPLYFTLSLQGLTELPSTFFALVAVLLFLRHFWGMAGFFAGLAFLTRFPHGLLFGTLFLFLLVKGRCVKKLAGLSVGFLLPVLLFFFFNMLLYADAPLFEAVIHPFLRASEEQFLPFYQVVTLKDNIAFYPAHLLEDNPFLLLTLPGFFFFFRKRTSSRWLLLLLLLVYAAYFVWMPSKVLRFALLFLPFMALFAGLFCAHLIRSYQTLCASLFAGLLFYVLLSPLLPSLLISAPPPPMYTDLPQDMLDGPIYTTVPYPAAYTDAAFVASFAPKISYFLLNEPSLQGILLVPDVWQCADDESCLYQKQKLLQIISEQYHLVRQEQYQGRDHLIYQKAF